MSRDSWEASAVRARAVVDDALILDVPASLLLAARSLGLDDEQVVDLARLARERGVPLDLLFVVVATAPADDPNSEV